MNKEKCPSRSSGEDETCFKNENFFCEYTIVHLDLS